MFVCAPLCVVLLTQDAVLAFHDVLSLQDLGLPVLVQTTTAWIMKMPKMGFVSIRSCCFYKWPASDLITEMA